VLPQGIPFGGFGHIGGIAISSEIATTLVETVVYCLRRQQQQQQQQQQQP